MTRPNRVCSLNATETHVHRNNSPPTRTQPLKSGGGGTLQLTELDARRHDGHHVEQRAEISFPPPAAIRRDNDDVTMMERPLALRAQSAPVLFTLHVYLGKTMKRGRECASQEPSKPNQ